MIARTYVGGMLALSLLLGGVAGAETGDTIPKERKAPELRQKIKDVQDAGKEKLDAAGNKLKEKSGAAREAIQAKTAELRAEWEAKKEEGKALIEKKRMEAGEMRETKKAELQERVKTIKDEKKRQIVERVAEKFGDINIRMSGHFEKALGKVEALAKRLENRVNALETEGADVSAVRNAITEALRTIEAAQGSIAAQAGKVYAVADAIKDEKTIGQNISALRETLRNDLKTVQDAVQSAKEKVRAAGEALKGVANVK